MSAFDEQQDKLELSAPRVLTNRRLVACAECGWVHYAMTAEEKLAADAHAMVIAERYRMSESELVLLELSMRQCLRCESPAASFRPAAPEDVAHAEGHLVTPVYVESAALPN